MGMKKYLQKIVKRFITIVKAEITSHKGENMAKLRSEIEEKYKWDLTTMFKNDEEFEKACLEFKNNVNEVEKYSGKIANEDKLFECLELVHKQSEIFGTIYVYANFKYHEDTNVPKYQEYADKVEGLATLFSVSNAFLVPELLALDEKDFKLLISSQKLRLYKHYLEDIARAKEHILSKSEEKILKMAQEALLSPENIYSTLIDTDFAFGKIKDDKGNEVELTHGNFITFLQSKNIEVRKSAYYALYEVYKKYSNTLATSFSGNVKSAMFVAKARKYNSTLEAKLDGDNIPKDVYTTLINTVEKYLPYMHKYIEKRKEILGLDKIHFHDLYVPIVKDANVEIEYEEAKKIVKKALEVLGDDYLDLIDKSYEEGWIDVYENKGKRSGAYSWGSYGNHPYVLLNYDNTIGEMFTLAHELGHAMHSYYTWETQPCVYGDYTTFLAEIASTVNETLLMEHLLAVTKDETEVAYLHNYFMEQFRGTIFRQTMFAEFEMLAHQFAEEGKALTADTLSNLYGNLCKKYYGDDIVIDDEIRAEWARIPHFYTPFYVFQYSTGYSAALALVELIKADKNNVEKYKELLKSGSSDYSIDLLKKAGVDMTTSKPIEMALDKFAKLVEKL